MSCYKCNIIEPPKLIDFGSNSCSKCGTSIMTTCYTCNGRGKDLLPYKYCENCGNGIYSNCSSCGGKGRVKGFHSCFKI